ncbi:MAG: hypothetical protein U0T69_12430 [Chitinophagales bacterium]
MQESYKIKIKVISFDNNDDLFFSQIMFNNGICSTRFEFYHYADEFKMLGNELISFPKNINHKINFEKGKNDENHWNYLLLNIFCHEINGESTISVFSKQNGSVENKFCCEFNIRCYPADINKLGKLLTNWNPNINNELLW